MSNTPALFSPKRTLEQRRQAVTNLWDFLVRGGIADLSRTPGEVIDTGRLRRLTRYTPKPGIPQVEGPVLLVPPLGAQSLCFDLRQGCSLAEHLVLTGRQAYLVDYDEVHASNDKTVGIEFWINDVIPSAIRRVSEEHGGAKVNLIGWSLGGLIATGTVATHPELPVNTVTVFGSPFDMSKVPLLMPFRMIGKATGGRILGTGIKAIGSIPSPIVSLGFKATAIPTYLRKPMKIWSRRDDRDFLGQIQAVDALMNNMLAYPGKATLQVYLQMAMRNEVATGKVQGPNKLVDFADVHVPVLAVAGTADVLAPIPAVHHAAEILTGSPEVRLVTAPGGHLGLLTGTSAATTSWKELDAFLNDYN
ncbi:alpha/beta fold hydrolase [Nocardioides jejuensis]|uniref:Alpha/beta fold hydrolase n=1 Tax=Nocardioides jejuensis TaxID=2502782 RepID=A0A4R1CGR7_9ACTN|nr:alpha/beta fold hydrolase [Nocardioides jejuensis]TCJ30359.1 alpha/beta fold hydrolase [Nocardioides jejuensis]